MRVCRLEYCDNKYFAKQYCEKHYRRFKKYGDPEKTYIFVPKKCYIEDCQKISKSKNLCELHYRRLLKTGTTVLIKEKQKCSVSGCTRKYTAKGYCRLHYEIKTQKIIIDEKSLNIIDNHNGLCDICGSDVPGFRRKKLCIDHDHKTGLFRGMLCQKCNLGLGNFNDDPELLKKAIRYLR